MADSCDSIGPLMRPGKATKNPTIMTTNKEKIALNQVLILNTLTPFDSVLLIILL